MVHTIFVIEGKEKHDIEQGRDFETTTYTFHEFSEADSEGERLIDKGIFAQIRIREYKPDEDDEGYVNLGSDEVKG